MVVLGCSILENKSFPLPPYFLTLLPPTFPYLLIPMVSPPPASCLLPCPTSVPFPFSLSMLHLCDVQEGAGVYPFFFLSQ